MDIRQQSFYTLEQLDSLIELPIQQVINCISGLKKNDSDKLLAEYIEFKGLVKSVKGETPEVFYVDGIFEVNKTEFISITDPDELCSVAQCLLKELKGTEHYQNSKVLIGNIYEPITPEGYNKPKYSYLQFESLVNRLGIPLKSYWPVGQEDFNYNIDLLNQKSNFTLEEASRIAGNAPLQDQQGTFYDVSLVEHYKEILSECVKGQNQHGFHLFTTELWCHSYSEDIGECSKRYDNGTHLKVSANIDIDLTIVSKTEFLRWCKYMDINTGLYNSQKAIDESVASLKLNNENLTAEIKRLKDFTHEIISEKKQLIECVKNITYPPELQLAVDAYKQLCLGQEKPPTNKKIEEWLQTESKSRGITHKDGSKTLKGLSEKKLSTIPSIIKSVKL
ncbi:hypothetical protein BCU94_07940 [Shewanella sp. 10N.286.52.C2]|uniref:hypothetical protein n=1 Tax=Shewanella sp. 10N.286.52.C2 TaxID=1880838 RepID=UPI000C831406|nr:hypothetical protein [Shewanella sp. 10N.286.52.C2]PMG31360.1 hypothetical protein BCU94_07940 [Shewanella sp. 10N.286.52.C2]